MTSHDPNCPGHDQAGQDHIGSRSAEPARRLFERATARLDVGTSNRLRLMRRDAQAQATPQQRLRSLLPMGASAAAVLALGLAWWLPREHGPDQSAAVALDAAKAAYIADDDAEVYAWLGDAPVAIDSKPAGAL